MKKPSVYVVDDEPQICGLLTRILEREGYAVRAFTSGQEALDAARADPPDLVVTDLMMPGMTGLELVRAVRETHPGVSAVLTTGYASIDNVVDALRSGVNDFVTKPFSVVEIRSVVSRVLVGVRTDAPPAPPPVIPTSTAKPPTTAEVPAANALLARRFRDMSLVEAIHGLLAGEPTSTDLLPRAESVLAASLGAGRAALLVPAGPRGTFRLRSTTGAPGPWTSRLDVESPQLAMIAASNAASVVAADSLGAVAQVMDRGPMAAAPLCPRDPNGPDAGLLVVSRPSPRAEFTAEDLRVLGVVANSLGEVLRAVRASERAEDAYFESLCGVVSATESRSPWFARHSERVRELSVALGRRVGLAAADLELLDMAARLLDLGRAGTPDEVLAKSGPPTADEWAVLRRHAACSDEVVRPLGRMRQVKPILRHHHENWDGTGYPDGLAGDAIPYLAAIVRIADAYAALTSARAWRPALGGAAAVRQIAELAGRHFHPALAAEFAAMQAADEPAAERVA
jgi:response regulator RpfG family c-di-GMP phosphodiesterase